MVFEPAVVALDLLKLMKGPLLEFTYLTPPNTTEDVADTCNGEMSPPPIAKLELCPINTRPLESMRTLSLVLAV